MQIGFHTQSAGIITAIVFVVMVLPVYIAAKFFNAERATIGWSALAVPVASAGAWLGYQLLGPFFGFLTGFIGMAVGFWLVLKPSFGGAFGLSLFAFVLQIAVIQLLLKFFAA
ncbi:hypothetical protein HPT27_08600 [Permianibacter sp. IMCC34836]|uniref:hypothetical protein n=1 Tax=Permianibacter fluminis TaxID=2738515 RepID=UPI00155262DB|nr:hypothetical protein [Permianibacter fluminis]NQD37082.1 hypothetical protein [Permianibacter fluminis]